MAEAGVLLAGGGTAGHVNPLLAVADELRRRHPHGRFGVLGTAEGLEARLVPEHGYDLHVVPRVPLPRRPTVDWLRLRGELRYGFGGFDGVVGDIALDAIYFSEPLGGITISAGPRMTLASSGYIDTYYGITPAESAFAQALGNPLTPYEAGGGIYSVGFGGQVLKRFTENITGSVFAEYKYLMDDAADSPLVVQHGDRNQFQAGVSLSYTFFLGFE